MIRFATIGSSFVTDWFVEASKHCKNLEYRAVYSRSADRAGAFARKYGVETRYMDLQELAAAKDIDAVYIASPNSFHCEQAVLMLEHGKHVLCENPAASNVKELSRMIDAARRNNVVFLEAMKNLFEPGFAAIKENLHKLGKIQRVSLNYCRYSPCYDDYKRGRISRTFDPTFSTGALMDVGVYCVHPLVGLFGEPRLLYADALLLSTGADVAGTIIARAGDDIQVEILYSKATQSRLPCQIQGDAATLVFDRISNIDYAAIYHKSGEVEELKFKKAYPTMTYQILKWYDYIKTGVLAHEHNEISLQALTFMDAVRKKSAIRFPAD